MATPTPPHTPAGSPGLPPRPGASGPPRPGAPAGATGKFNVAIDPLKLLRQYYPWLIAAGALGVVLGVATHFALLFWYPIYRGEVYFEFMAPIQAADEVSGAAGAFNAESEIERFIGTQRLIMLSENVLAKAARDGEVANETQWAQRFVSNSGQYDEVEAFLELEDIINASAMPDTNILMLSARATDKSDAATLANIVASTYLAELNSTTRIEVLDVEEALTNRLNAIREERRLLEDRMRRLLTENEITTTSEEMTVQAGELSALQPVLLEVRYSLENLREQLKQYEEQLTAPGGATYPEMVRAQVAQHPIMQNFDAQIAQVKALLRQVKREFGPNHREVKRYERSIDAMQAERAATEQQLLGETFVQLVEFTRSQIRSNETLEAETLAAMEKARRELSEIKATLEEYEQLSVDVGFLTEQESDMKGRIEESRAVRDRAASKRVKLIQAAEPPDRPIFPLWYIVVPAVTFLCVMFAGAVVVTREMLEQRVRGPADVNLIPRMPIFGVVPDMAEDLSKPTAMETAVLDRPNGVIAESVRAIRTSLVKRAGQHGHKVILIVSGMPGSGGTSIIANLGASLASCELKTLLIDGNFRRPGLHKATGVQAEPGLSDVLARQAAFESVVQHTQQPGLDVLSAGTVRLRMTERLMTAALTETLLEARERYDFILVDAPPAIVSSDSLTIASRCDATALVVRAFSEKRGLVARIRNQLSDAGRAEFLGVIVNGVRSSAGGYFRRNFIAAHQYTNGRTDKDKETGAGGGGVGEPAAVAADSGDQRPAKE